MKHGDAIDSPDGRYVWIDDGVSPPGWYSCFWWGSKPDTHGGHTKGELTEPRSTKRPVVPMPETLGSRESVQLKRERPVHGNRRARALWNRRTSGVA